MVRMSYGVTGVSWRGGQNILWSDWSEVVRWSECLVE